MISLRNATLLAVALLACSMVTGSGTATDAPVPAILTSNNSTTTPGGPTPAPNATSNGSLSPSDINRILRTDPANASRERIDRLVAWASEPENVRSLKPGQVREVRVWLLEAGRSASISMEVPALSIDIDLNGTAATTTTSKQAANETRNNSSTETAGYGVVDELARNPGNVSAQQVEQTIVDGLYVTRTEFHDEGYALVTVVATRPSITFSATDSNSIGGRGSGKVAAERVQLPRGKFTVKVPASVEGGDQTVVIGVNVENSYWFSNHAKGGEGVLSKVDGWTPWIGGLGAGLTWVVIAGVVVLAGEQSGVEVAGENR